MESNKLKRRRESLVAREKGLETSEDDFSSDRDY